MSNSSCWVVRAGVQRSRSIVAVWHTSQLAGQAICYPIASTKLRKRGVTGVQSPIFGSCSLFDLNFVSFLPLLFCSLACQGSAI